ncbi:MAG: TatD family hydrolase [Fretibacterium sp.]|nr:TatD family hydrolase [Fretibacterium sp.]
MFFIDAHCHLDSKEYEENVEIFIERAFESGVRRFLTVGCDLETSRRAVMLACRFEWAGVFASVGVHPHEAVHYAQGLPDELLALAEEPRVVAIGEAGLDYYYDHSPRDVQNHVFAMQVDWALELQKPLMLHVRDAMDDVLVLLRSASELRDLPELIFHCYSGGFEYLDAVLALGASCSLAGPVTWKKNDSLRELSAQLPAERLLLETDCPWLTPAPFRGKLNEPSYVRYVYEVVAAARGCSLDALTRQVDENTDNLFGWGRVYV